MKMQQTHLQEQNQKVLNKISDELAESLAEQSDALTALGLVLSRDPVLREALEAGNRERLLAAHASIFARLRDAYGVTHLYFHGADRVNLARVHKPEKHGDRIDRFTIREAERTGAPAAGVELGPLGTFTLRSVRPILDGDALIGYLELGKEIEDILAGLHKGQGVEAAVVIFKSALDRTRWEAGMAMLGRGADWDRYRNKVIIYSSMPRLPSGCDRFIMGKGHAHNDATRETTFGGKQWRVMVSPLDDVSGAEVGDLIILNDITGEKAAFNRFLVMVSAVGLVLLAGLFGFLFSLLRRTDQGIREQQAALVESESFLRSLTGALPDYIFALDADGVIQNVNRVHPGHGKQDVIGRKAASFTRPGYRDAFEEALAEAVASGRIQTVEIMVDFPDGRHFFLSRLNPAPLAGSGPAILLIATDITDRKRAEEALRESERKFSKTFHSNPAAVAINDLSDGRTIDVNESYLKMTGRDKEDVLGRSSVELGVWVDADRRETLIERLKARGSIHNFEFDFRRKTGETGKALLSAEIIGIDGKPCMLSIVNDITELKRAWEMLRIERDKLKGVLGGVGEGMYIVDKAYTVEYQNVVIETLSPDGAGLKCHELYMESASPCEFCKLGESISSGEIRRTETVFMKGGVYDMTFSPFTDMDGEVKAIVLARDVTEKKILQAEAARAGQLASLGELAAGVAHEINNPMNGIISYAEVLKDECEDKGEDDDIPVRIIREGERVAGIVRNLLSFAREQSVHPAPVHTRQILANALGLVDSRVKLDGIHLSADIPPGLPEIIARSHEIQQVFLNLISNARYALGRKFPARHEDKTLEIRGEAVEIQGRKYVRTTFRDAGPGIPEKILDKIINPFFSTKPRGRGTGLGLSISHGIVEAHGGKLWFESVEGEYTKAIVDLPGEEKKVSYSEL
ncbi:MAG: PAS domain S-box protein [Desulfobacterales bacterium]|nr:PAS domain S-box protein [Desulfobacterales bacterium]